MAQITLNSSGVASNGALALQSNGTTTAVTIDTSQNVGIGTNSPSALLDVSKAVQGAYSTFRAFGPAGQILWANGGASTSYLDSDTTIFRNSNASGNVERMRIDSSGNLLVGATSQVGAGKVGIAFDANTFQGLALRELAFGSGSTFVSFRNSANTAIGSIAQSGTSNVVYNTSSDYRLKENIAPMTGALAKVQSLKPVTYNWKSDGSDGQGFIAHELQEVVPDCVTGEKDAVDSEGNPVYQGIDTSFLVATLTAAIKEQQAIITSLTDRITALEAK